jgi:hypothetical protein
LIRERANRQRAECGAQAWRAVAPAQRMAAPHHGDFYALAGSVVDTLAALAAVAQVLADKVEGYANGRPVYDDTGTVDPRERLAAAEAELRLLRRLLHEADVPANRFWSAIGHIGVEVTP